jgi:hypothetical protein
MWLSCFYIYCFVECARTWHGLRLATLQCTLRRQGTLIGRKVRKPLTPTGVSLVSEASLMALSSAT